MIVTVDSLMGRVVNQERDHWGRWVIQEFTGRGNRRFGFVFSVSTCREVITSRSSDSGSATS